jgi:hypothetical protein
MKIILGISIIIVCFEFFVALNKSGLFPVILTSELIRAYEPIPTSENFPVGTPTITNEMKYASSYAFEWSSLPEDEQNFWMILASLVPSLISIVISLM